MLDLPEEKSVARLEPDPPAPGPTARDRNGDFDIPQRRTSEEKLPPGELLYRTLFDLVPEAVYFTDAEGVIREFNQRAVELWGRSPKTETERFCGSFKIFYPDGTPMPHANCPMARVLRGEKLTPSDCEIIVQQPDGARRTVVVNPRVLQNDRGEIVGAINCLHDITDRKGAEAALRESEERFRQFSENSADVFWIVNAEQRYLEYLNPAYERIWGAPRADWMQDINLWLEMVHPEDRAKAASAMPKVLAGQSCVVEYRIIRPSDGAVRWIRDTGFPMPNEEGRITRVAGVAQDITEDKERARAIERAEERFRLLVEGAQEYAMFLLNADNRIAFWSTGAERLFGWTQDEAVGQSGELIFAPEDRARGAVEREIETARREGRAPDKRWHLRKDGSRFWTDGVMMRLDADDGAVRGYAKIARDASDQRLHEEALQHARDELEQRVLERTADLLTTNAELERTIAQREQLERELLEISEREKRRIGQDLHDIVCQELTATALFLKSAGNRATDKETARTLNEAAQIVNRNVSLARDLARGFQPVIIGSGGLTSALRSLCTQANTHPEITCHLKMPKAIRIKDETVALNLFRIAQEGVSNAIRHAGASEISVCVEREDGFIRLVVQDDGKGFRMKKRSKGLGVHIMHYRASVLGGALTIAAKAKGGTKITAVVPNRKK